MPKAARKLHPAFDEVLRRVLELDAAAVVVVLAHSTSDRPAAVEEALRARWRAAGLPCGPAARPRCVVLSQWLDSEEFLSWVRHADVLLETFPFGGFTSTLQGLQLGRPWVALRDPEGSSAGLMSAAFLDALGLSDFRGNHLSNSYLSNAGFGCPWHGKGCIKQMRLD